MGSSASPSSWPIGSRVVSQGTILEFDADRGIGTVEDVSGRRLFFHCTAISDGTRNVDVGMTVTFSLAAGHRGLLEARGIAKS